MYKGFAEAFVFSVTGQMKVLIQGLFQMLQCSLQVGGGPCCWSLLLQSDDIIKFLGWWNLVVCKLIHPKRLCLTVTKMLGQTQRQAMDGCKGWKLAKDILLLGLQHSHSPQAAL